MYDKRHTIDTYKQRREKRKIDMNSIKSYVVDGLLLEIEGNCASVDYWSERTEYWEALDTTTEFLQSLIDEADLPLVAGERLGWREMGNEYSSLGYFSITEVAHEH